MSQRNWKHRSQHFNLSLIVWFQMYYYFTLEEQWQWLGSNTKRSKPSRCTKPSIFLTVQHVVPIWIELWVTKLKIWVAKQLHQNSPLFDSSRKCLPFQKAKNFLYLEQSWHAVAFSPGTASCLYLLVSQGQDSLLAQTRDGWYPHCRALPTNIETDSNADYWGAFSVFLKCSALYCHRDAYQIQFLMCLYYNYHMLSDFFFNCPNINIGISFKNPVSLRIQLLDNRVSSACAGLCVLLILVHFF